MNTKIYKAVLTLAESMMIAVQQKNEKQFSALYKQLNQLCIEHENSAKDHPVQWETLADFTDDFNQAISLYEKAFSKAKEINNKDHLASIGYAMASLQIELGQVDTALINLKQAQLSANKIPDKELKAEIDSLIKSIS